MAEPLLNAKNPDSKTTTAQDAVLLEATKQAYAQMTPAGQDQLYTLITTSGDGQTLYKKDRVIAGAIGAAAGAVLAYVVLGMISSGGD